MIKIGKALVILGIISLKIKSIIAWGLDKWKKISPTIQPIIEEVEKSAADKIITRDERKQIAMVALANMEKSGALKLNWLTRKLLGVIVNKVAEKLPDIDVSIQAPQLVADAIKQVKG
ncbi:MAG: hypothetical protein ABSB18_06380 [Candidatus Omnitrophota bacterium]